MNSATVVSPSPTQVPGPTAALNEVGSQSSRALTVFVFDFVSDNATVPPVTRTVNARAALVTARSGVPRDGCMIASPVVSGGSVDRYQHPRYVSHGQEDSECTNVPASHSRGQRGRPEAVRGPEPGAWLPFRARRSGR